jgi:hypothetical protein
VTWFISISHLITVCMTLRRGFQGRQGVSVTRLLMGLTAATCFAVAGVTTHRLDLFIMTELNCDEIRS